MTKITPQTAAIQRVVLTVKDRLAEASTDEIIPHKDIRDLIPAELENFSHYIFVQRAIRLLNAENGAVFATVRGEGYRRLANVIGADYSSNVALLRIRRQSRRGQKFATMAIKFANSTTDNDKRRIYQKLATLGLIEHLSLRKSVTQMPDDPPETPNALAGLRQLLDQVAAAK